MGGSGSICLVRIGKFVTAPEIDAGPPTFRTLTFRNFGRVTVLIPGGRTPGNHQGTSRRGGKRPLELGRRLVAGGAEDLQGASPQFVVRQQQLWRAACRTSGGPPDSPCGRPFRPGRGAEG